MSTHAMAAVALPAGLHNGRPRVNIYLTPRLSGAPLLSAFPDWLDWTGLVARHGLHITVSCGGGTATVAADTSALRPQIWRSIFGHDSIVRDYPDPDFDQRLLVSYPSRTAHQFLRYAFQSASTTGSGLAGRELRVLLEDLVFRDASGQSTLDETLAALRVQMWDQQQGDGPAGPAPTAIVGPAPPPAKPAGTRPMVERLALYYRMPPAPNREPLPSTPSELANLLDFHQALSALSSYPMLLTALGLVLPVEVPPGLISNSPNANAYQTLRVSAVTPGWTWSIAPTLGLPDTAYTRDADTFTAAPASTPDQIAAGQLAPGDILDGFLALSPNDFHLVGVDIDGAMLKAMALADSLDNAGGADDSLLPSLRSSGISLCADDRAQQLLQSIRDNKSFDTVLSGGTTRPLTAPDLTRGYRVDIYSDRTGQWDSLHRRDGTYRIGATGNTILSTADEEGFVQLAVAQPANDPTRPTDTVAAAAGAPQPGTDLYVHERVTRWNNWGLSAPRPGTPLNRSPDPAQATHSDPTMGAPVTGFPLATSFVTHRNSLPQLRFGARYQLRARAVDLAGNSPALSAHAADTVVLPADGDLLPHYRFEPVGPPLVVLRTQPGLGGSLLELVIRSHNSDPTLDTVVTAEVDDRHLAPPRAAEQLVEQHGMLDDASGKLPSDLATYQFIVERDRSEIPAVDGDPIESGDQLTVSYFPDPLARGLAFGPLPQVPERSEGAVAAGALTYVPRPGPDPAPQTTTKIGFGAAWPDRQAMRIRIVEGNAVPAWDGAGRVLTVSLLKGQVASTAVSCFLDPADLDMMGVWSWILELFEALAAFALGDTEAGPDCVEIGMLQSAVTQQALDGGNEFLTPSVALTLTHAVQQPLGRPTWTRLPVVHNPASPIVAASLANSFSPVLAWRSVGSHHAVLLGALQINGATTAAIDIEARWIDWVDDVSEPGPTTVPSAGHVDRVPLATLDGGPLDADGSGQRQVAVYLPGIDTLWLAAPFDHLDGVDSPGQVAAPVHQLGDTKHRTVKYRAVASSRFQEYFDPAFPTTRTGAALTVDVPSSARPQPPDIAYVVPTFGWQREVTTNVKTEVRLGNAVRVYLRRPWYSSGSAEELGVVLWPGGQTPPTDEQREADKSVFTQWGLDPIWASGSLDNVPATGDFPLAAHTASALTLQESALDVDVAGHGVEYDPQRRLWYCDIALDNPSAYTPFVRLALARYQPRSIAGVELSHVVLADYAQLAPDRAAALTVDPADPRSARIVVAGLAPSGPTRSLITVTVEARINDVPTDLGWRTAAPGDVQITEDTPAPSQPEAVLYAGAIRFTHRPLPDRFRVMVREFEILQIDTPAEAMSDKPEYGSRLIYASILPLDYPFTVQP